MLRHCSVRFLQHGAVSTKTRVIPSNAGNALSLRGQPITSSTSDTRDAFVFLNSTHHTVIPSEARNLSFFPLVLFTKCGSDGRGPVRKMVERFRVRGIEMQRRDGNGAGKNRGVIRVRLHVLVDSLFEEPEITAPARIFSLAELVARDFLRLPSKFH